MFSEIVKLTESSNKKVCISTYIIISMKIHNFECDDHRKKDVTCIFRISVITIDEKYKRFNAWKNGSNWVFMSIILDWIWNMRTLIFRLWFSIRSNETTLTEYFTELQTHIYIHINMYIISDYAQNLVPKRFRFIQKAFSMLIFDSKSSMAMW